MKYSIDNPDNNEWLAKYNELCATDFSGATERLSLHHILPRNKYPELANDICNHALLPIRQHWEAHYYLWKADRQYALEFWFCYVYFRKHKNWQLTPEEHRQLCLDCAWCRKQRKLARQQ
jgi:hypothetical protein